MHTTKNLIHRDVKPPNVLWYHGGIIKLTDFNHAIELDRLVENKWKGNCGTPWFKAPELLMDMQYSYPIDIWSLGCVFEYLLTGECIFRFDVPKNEKHNENYKRRCNLEAIFGVLGKPTNKVWPNIERVEMYQYININDNQSFLLKYLKDRKVEDPLAIKLLQRMFTYNPADRITASEILEDPYLKGACPEEEMRIIQTIKSQQQH